MGKFDKLVHKILNGKNVTYSDAENVLLSLGFVLKVRGSHHIFRKAGYERTVSIKNDLSSLIIKLMI
jgi:predicted RNA binding protein YcfA (HicA-like mRNA interferase family)